MPIDLNEHLKRKILKEKPPRLIRLMMGGVSSRHLILLILKTIGFNCHYPFRRYRFFGQAF